MYDTLSYTEKLEETGIEKKQAEAIVKNQFEMIKDNLATKDDLKSVRSDFMLLRKDFSVLRKDFESLENKITIKFGKMLFSGFGLTIVILGLIIRWPF